MDYYAQKQDNYFAQHYHTQYQQQYQQQDCHYYDAQQHPASLPPVLVSLVGLCQTNNNPEVETEDQEFKATIRALTATIGRRQEGWDPRPNFIALDHHQSRGVSRSHAIIRYLPSTASWKIECASKNGFVVDGKFRGQGAKVPLKHGSSIEIGPLTAKFLLPGNAGSLTSAALPVAPETTLKAGLTKVPRVVVSHVLFPPVVKEKQEDDRGRKRSRER